MKIHDCETGSLEWHELHLGMPTAGNFHKLLTPGGAPALNDTTRGYMYRLLGERFTGMPDPEGDIGYLPHIANGVAREPQAVGRYELEHEVDVRTIGFVVESGGRWGATPDGGVYLGQTLLRCLECKSPGPKAHMQYAELPNWTERKHLAQATGQMMACEVEECALLVFHPELPDVEALVHIDEDYAAKLREALDRFCDELDEATERFAQRRGYKRRTKLHPEWVERYHREEEMRETGWQGVAA